MTDAFEFGRVVLIFAGGATLAILSSKVTERVPVPAPAIFLLAAAVASWTIPGLGEQISTRVVVHAVEIALALILFDGGMGVGWQRFRDSGIPIVSLGVVGTFVTTGVVAVAAHYLFGFPWMTAGLIGTAIAPTDPAVMFSVFGRRDVVGRSRTILEGESGANDPVGIALMLGLLDAATSGNGSGWSVAGDFALQMAVGVAVGIAGAALLLWLMRRSRLPSEGLYPLRTLTAALLIFGIASVFRGSGFLAVFVAGIAIGDAQAPFKREIVSFHSSLASLGEIVAFTALGLTIHLDTLTRGSIWAKGLLLAALLALVIRPLVIGSLLLPVRLDPGEKIFAMWGGLKGAVPILLGSFAVLAGVKDAGRVYDLVFVVVAFSVIVQGATMFALARRVKIPMRFVSPQPWDG